ncbi:uncharacterized protein [Antedon mediterranea]|uniref:uncharacterized protein n=1 Tax=Antedon mediterranea TaxID=105859 RepID=UPI003AF4942B
MSRIFSSSVLIVLFLNIFATIDSASIAIARDKRSATRPSNTRLREFSYTLNPKEIIELAFGVNGTEAHRMYHEAYNKDVRPPSRLSKIQAEIELDEFISATSQTMCKKPLPKAVNLYERLHISESVILSPAGIAVNKCSQESGCCTPGLKCVGIEFRLRNFTYLHIENHELTVRRFEELEDTRCSCHSQNTDQREEVSSCGENQEFDETIAVCRCLNIVCPTGSALNQYLCQCENVKGEKEAERNEVEENEVEEIESGEVEHRNCSEGQVFSLETKQCECANPCPTGTTMDPSNCACEDSRRTPSLCGYIKCPKPFHTNETTCKCECDNEDKNCEKFMKGRKEVNSKHCRNVKSGDYGTPSCIEGMLFNSEEGRCRCEWVTVERSVL